MAETGDDLGVESYYQSFSAGETLFYAGAPASEIFLIREGRVRLLKRARGVERTTGLFGAEDLLGEEALLPGAHRSATAEAIEPVIALVIDSDTFRALVRKRPEVGESAMQQLVRRLRQAEAQIGSAMVSDPTLRILNALLLEVDEQDHTPLSLSPLELSTRTGLDVDRVKAVVGQLRDRGYLHAGDQTITIDDPASLRELHDLLALKEDALHGLGCR